MHTSRLIVWSAVTSIAGGVAWIVLWILFLLTHGPGPEDRKGAMFRLTSLDYGKFAVIPVVLFASGLVGLHLPQKGQSGRLGKAGLAVALIGFSVMIVSVAVSLWPIPWGSNADDVDWQAPLPKYSSILASLSSLVVSVGIILFAVGFVKARAGPRWIVLPLVLGSLAAVPWLYMTPWGGLAGLAWLLFGCAVYIHDRSNGG
jgi:hypothetical protein